MISSSFFDHYQQFPLINVDQIDFLKNSFFQEYFLSKRVIPSSCTKTYSK